jgi:hypothetical protein
LSTLAYPVALLAAAVFAIAISLEHRAAETVPHDGRLGPQEISGTIRATVRNRWWLTGMTVHVLGFGVHALALNLGGLAVVQPLLVANLLFALPVNHWMRRERVRLVEVGWAVVLVVGLTGFLRLAAAGVPAGTEAADRGPAIAAGAFAGLVAAFLSPARSSWDLSEPH